MLRSTTQLARSVFDLLLPPICAACGDRLVAGDETICRACRDSFEPVGRLICCLCGAPVARAVARRCPKCPSEPVHFQSARSAYLYRGYLPGVFYAFKYRHRMEVGVPLARLMFRKLEPMFSGRPWPDVLVPVPLHFLRRMTRGYNQSDILASEFGRLAGIRCAPDLLARIRSTPRQALLPPERRAKNVRGAFEAPSAERVRDLSVGLVDDMMTTGNTVNECARVLMEAGAASVHVLSFGRA